MMNKYSLWLSVVLVLISTVSVCADTKSNNRRTVFNKTTDYLATIGKSEQDKKEIVNDRRDTRRQVRLRNEDRRKRAQTKERMKQQEKNMMRKIYTQ